MSQNEVNWDAWYEMLHKAKPESKEWYEIASMMENHHIRASIVNRGPESEDQMLEEAEAALKSAQGSLGKNHPRAAEAMQNLGFFYLAIKNESDTALDYFQNANLLAGARNPVLALTYFRVGLYWYQKEDAHRAEEALKEALAIRRADSKADREDIAETLFILSYATAVTTGHKAATKLAQEALDLLKSSSPKSKLLPSITKRVDELGGK